MNPTAPDLGLVSWVLYEHSKKLIGQGVFVSATPGPYELRVCGSKVIQQVIRPTGLVDPEMEVRPIEGQVDNLIHEVRERASVRERVLVHEGHYETITRSVLIRPERIEIVHDTVSVGRGYRNGLGGYAGKTSHGRSGRSAIGRRGIGRRSSR